MSDSGLKQPPTLPSLTEDFTRGFARSAPKNPHPENTAVHLTVIQHVPFEGPAGLEDWARSRGHSLRIIRRDLDQPLPHHVEAIVVLGGPMGVHDGLPGLEEERLWLASHLAAERPVLGICLGAQLLTQVLGGEVSRGKHEEIGWHPIFAIDAPADFPELIHAMHWHGDQCQLPPGARHWYASEQCPVQIYSVDNHVLALQCHLETRPNDLAALIGNDDSHTRTGPAIQNATTIQAGTSRYQADANRLFEACCDRWLDGKLLGIDDELIG